MTMATLLLVDVSNNLVNVALMASRDLTVLIPSSVVLDFSSTLAGEEEVVVAVVGNLT